MALHREVKKTRGAAKSGRERRLLALDRLLFVFVGLMILFVPVGRVMAVPATPILLETDWKTGELEVCYANVNPGWTIKLYTRTAKDTAFTFRDSWTATETTGCYTTSYYENGQTIWHYILQVDPVTGDISPGSDIAKQTPPLTAYVINWPDMFNGLKDLADQIVGAVNNLNTTLVNKLDSLVTPSQPAMDNLKDAVDELKDATGGGTASTIGDNIKTGIEDVQTGMHPPVVHDDGVGTFTGGATPEQLPSPTSGTMNDLSFKVKLFKQMNGQWYEVALFTDEQLEKMKWWAVIKDLAGITIFIVFGVWVVVRFTPSFKV